MRNRWFQVVPQLLMVALFVFLIYAGLAGSRVRNITPVAVWTLWWGGLIFAIEQPARFSNFPWSTE